VVRVPCYRSRGPGSIPGATRFSEKWAWKGVHSASWVQLRSYLKEKVAAPVKKFEITAVGDPPLWLRDIPVSAKVGTNFSNKRRSLARVLRQQSLFVFKLMTSSEQQDQEKFDDMPEYLTLGGGLYVNFRISSHTVTRCCSEQDEGSKSLGFWTLRFFRVSKLENTTFRKLDLSLSPGERSLRKSGPVIHVSSFWTVVFTKHLELRKIGKVHKPSDSECYPLDSRRMLRASLLQDALLVRPIQELAKTCDGYFSCREEIHDQWTWEGWRVSSLALVQRIIPVVIRKMNFTKANKNRLTALNAFHTWYRESRILDEWGTGEISVFKHNLDLT
jgi:hypothetical protein